MKKAFITLLAIAAMVGCSKSDEGFNNTSDNTAKFRAETITSRTTEIQIPNPDNELDTLTVDAWEMGDLIGIFTSGFGSGAEYANIDYKATTETTSQTTDFSVVSASKEIVFPNAPLSDAKTVDFYAYYPYTTAVDENNYITVSVANQKDDFGKIDFMTASATNIAYYLGAEYSEVVFNFEHKLSKVVFNISCNENIESLAGLSASLNNISTSGEYDYNGTLKASSSLGESDNIELATVVASDNKTAIVTGILHPGAYTTPTLSFSVANRTFEVTFASTLTASYSHIYNIALGYDIVGFENGSTIDKWENASDQVTEIYPEEVL